MKALLSILLGLMLLTSVVSISYAAPIGSLQPLQPPNNGACSYQPPNNTSNMNETQSCHSRDSGGNGGRDTHGCRDSITPNRLEVSDIQADPFCVR